MRPSCREPGRGPSPATWAGAAHACFSGVPSRCPRCSLSPTAGCMAKCWCCWSGSPGWGSGTRGEPYSFVGSDPRKGPNVPGTAGLICPGCGTGLGMPPYCRERGKPRPLEGPTSRVVGIEAPLGSSTEDDEKEEEEEEEEEAGALEVARYGGGFPPFSRRCCLLPGPSGSRDRVQTLPVPERPVRRLLFSRLPSSLIQNSSSVSPSSPGKCFIIARWKHLSKL